MGFFLLIIVLWYRYLMFRILDDDVAKPRHKAMRDNLKRQHKAWASLMIIVLCYPPNVPEDDSVAKDSTKRGILYLLLF
jgi:hypothetical protein